MSIRMMMALGALALGAGSIAAPAEARTVVRIGIGAPLYAGPYRWAYYPGYYAPPPGYYYRPPPVVIRPYWGWPYRYRPYYARPYWRRW